MYKNKIRNRLEKINTEAKDITFRNQQKGNVTNETVLFTSHRKNKLSLSKDINVNIHQKEEVSEQKNKRKYLKVVSKEKQVRNTSPPLQNEQIIINKSKSHRHQLKKPSSFDESNKGNITKSTVTLNQQIVPILLINQDTQQDSKTNNSYIYKTPIRMLKSNEQQNWQTTQIANNSKSASNYKNKHRINLSPNPIKKMAHCTSSYSLKKQPSYHHFCHSKSQMFQQTNHSQICQLANKLNEIHLKRKAIQERISSKLDILSEKAGLSRTEQSNPHDSQTQQHTDKPKILCLNQPNIALDKNPSSKIKHYKQSIKQKDKNLRNVIMNRIYS